MLVGSSSTVPLFLLEIALCYYHPLIADTLLEAEYVLNYFPSDCAGIVTRNRKSLYDNFDAWISSFICQ